MTFNSALQLASPPQFDHLHVQVHGPLHETEVAVPELQRFELGALRAFDQFALPQEPPTGKDWQETLPSEPMDQIALPAGQVAETRLCHPEASIDASLSESAASFTFPVVSVA